MSITLDEIIEKLHAILNEEPGESRGEMVTKFNDLILLTDDIEVSEEIENVLTDLCADLEYYVSNPESRKENSSYYGDERLEQEINEAFQKIELIRNQR